MHWNGQSYHHHVNFVSFWIFYDPIRRTFLALGGVRAHPTHPPPPAYRPVMDDRSVLYHPANKTQMQTGYKHSCTSIQQSLQREFNSKLNHFSRHIKRSCLTQQTKILTIDWTWQYLTWKPFQPNQLINIYLLLTLSMHKKFFLLGELRYLATLDLKGVKRKQLN